MGDGSSKRMELVPVLLLATVQDQPEQRECAGWSLGGLGVHPRWGWLSKWSAAQEKLPPCPNCKDFLIRTNDGDNGLFWTPLNCENCSNWMQPGSELKCALPDDYPTKELPDDGPITDSRPLTFLWVQLATATARANLQNKNWNLTKFRSHLKNNGLNAAVCEGMEQSVKDSVEWQEPPFWASGLGVQQFAEPCMHQLFLGVNKDNHRQGSHLGCCQQAIFIPATQTGGQERTASWLQADMVQDSAAQG